ncbi:MAG: hypothetical protein ABIR79_10435, partial [Candidatus Binatia bacterium]
TDDDVVYTATLPAGSLIERTPGRNYSYDDPTGAIGGIRKIRLRVNKHGTGVLSLDTVRLDLSQAEANNHRLSVQLASGDYDQTDSRTWELLQGKLKTQR